jgi:large subunit ribosomal protein L6
MKTDKITETIEIPEGVQVSHENNLFVIKGPKGELKRRFFNPRINIEIKNNEIILSCGQKPTKREKKLIYTFKAHLLNMMKGIISGHIYKLRIFYTHFPMNVSVREKVFEVKNFIGENTPRKLVMPEGINVEVKGNEVIVEGIDKEKTAQAAADIETLTKRPGFDKRIFQDGIYIYHKDGKDLI